MGNGPIIESPISLWADYIGVVDETAEKQEDPSVCAGEFSPEAIVTMGEVAGRIGVPRAVRFHAMTFSFVVEDVHGHSVGFPIQDLTRAEKRETAMGMLATLRSRITGEESPQDFYSWAMLVGDSDVGDQ